MSVIDDAHAQFYHKITCQRDLLALKMETEIEELSYCGLVNPRRACAARVTVLGLRVYVCVCVTQHLTFRVTVQTTNHTSHSLADEGRKF